MNADKMEAMLVQERLAQVLWDGVDLVEQVKNSGLLIGLEKPGWCSSQKVLCINCTWFYNFLPF